MEWIKNFIAGEAGKLSTKEGALFFEKIHKDPLNLCLNKYKKLLETRSDLELEERLQREFPKKDFHALSLPVHTIPKIHRPLPTLDDRYQNQIEQVPGEYLDFGRLTRHYIDKALVSLYPAPKKGKVLLFTYVMSDGLGDFSAQSAAAEVLKEKAPFLDVQFLTLLPKGVRVDFPHSGLRIEYRDEEDLHFRHFSKEALELFSSADLVLQINTEYPHWEGLKKLVRRAETLGEYGFIASTRFHPKTENRCMGLHFLEKGIFIKNVPPLEGEPYLENRELSQNLFEGKGVGDYQKAHRLHLAYLLTEEKMFLFLDALFTLYEKDEKPIDLVFQNIQRLLGCLQTYFHDGKDQFPLLTQKGIRELEIHHEGDRFIVPIAPEGKNVRFFSFDSLSPGDFQKLLAISGPFFGCRGNQTFSEAVSAGKLFFYEVQPHTQGFFKDVIALARARVAKGNRVVEYLEAHLDPIHGGRRMGKLLQDPKVVGALEKLGAILREEYTVGPYLCGVVSRALVHLQHPEIARKEEELTLQLIDQKIDFVSYIQEMKRILGNL